MLTLNSPQVVQETILRWKREHRVAFVPTMGNLHDGHLRLVTEAKRFGTKVIVSIFVNPLQFGPKEDFARYPRTLQEDTAKLEAAGADLLFAPEVDDLYPPGFSTRVIVGHLAEPLCGSFRPGHFDGVATVCLKLFQITQADFAVFGEKDFQQLRVLQQLVADFNLPLTIVPVATVREPDGLALSSRNQYLSPEDRKVAPALYEALRLALDAETAGEALARARARLEPTPFQLEYLEIVSGVDLKPVDPAAHIAAVPYPRIFAAARLGTTRLIDNLSLEKRDE